MLVLNYDPWIFKAINWTDKNWKWNIWQYDRKHLKLSATSRFLIGRLNEISQSEIIFNKNINDLKNSQFLQKKINNQTNSLIAILNFKKGFKC